jgi:hypothetical protein
MMDAQLFVGSLAGYSERVRRANHIVIGEASEATVVKELNSTPGSFIVGLQSGQRLR